MGEGCGVCGGDVCEIERGVVGAVDRQGVFIGFNAADQRIHCAMACSKDVFDLAANFAGVGNRRRRVVVESGAAALVSPLDQ